MSHFLIVHAQKTAREHEFTEIFGNQFLYYEKSDEKPNPDVWQCIMIGIPAEMTLDECRLFFEPYGNDIYHITVIHDSVMHGCKAAVIQFHLKESMESFCRLYCHLHFPAHSSAAPCLVVPLQDFVVIDDNSSPAVENSPSSANVMPTIPQETTAASIPSIPDDSSGSVLSPPPPAHLQLPNCPVCLRRISDKASGVCATQDVIVGPDFTGHADRCPVCFIVSEDGRDRRHCAVCGLKENLWVCLQCAYTGCGRYTSQHAKKHFHDKGHPFSLECATGRLWDYVHDKFVHLDPFTIYTKNIASREMLETSSITSQQAYPEPSPLVLQSSGPVCSASLEDNGEKEATWTLEKPIAEDMSQDEIIKSHLDNGVVDKIGKLQQDYEQLLVSQLNDQRLHYEKLLARETVRLLEMGYDVKGVFKEASSDSVYIERADAAMIPCPGASGESKVAIDENMSMDGSLDSDMAQIEQLKMDISGASCNIVVI